MLRDPNKQVMEKAYARWAPVYDVLCGPVFLNGRRAAARAARDVGGRILEIGVGTGLSFDDYDASTEITGIDISEPMIARARLRAASGRYPFVKGLAVMDAHNLRYDDGSFDCVVGQFVITLVEDPERVLSECARVVRPGGELIILTRVSADEGMRRVIERTLQPVVTRLGFRTADFAWSRYTKWLAGAKGMELVERRLIPPLGHFSLVRFRKIEVAKAA